MQADELKLRSKMDHMRWNLVQVVIDRLPKQMEALREDETNYIELLQSLLKHAAEQIEQEVLEVSLNHDDLRRLKPQWAELTEGLAAGKRFELLDKSINTIGGCLVATQDRQVQIDHTFEGRLDRLERKILQALVERLLPPVGEGQAL